MQTNPAAEQSKIVRWSESPWNQSGGKGKVYGGKDLRIAVYTYSGFNFSVALQLNISTPHQKI